MYSNAPHFLIASQMALNPKLGLWIWAPSGEPIIPSYINRGTWVRVAAVSTDRNDIFCTTRDIHTKPVEPPPFLALMRQRVARQTGVTVFWDRGPTKIFDVGGPHG